MKQLDLHDDPKNNEYTACYFRIKHILLIGATELFRSDLLCVEWDHKSYTLTHVLGGLRIALALRMPVLALSTSMVMVMVGNIGVQNPFAYNSCIIYGQKLRVTLLRRAAMR